MKFIIYVAGNIRNGQRVGLADFPYSEAYGKFIYQCRELTLEEFNAAAVIVFSPTYHSNEFTFCPLAIDPEAEAKAAAESQRLAEEAAAAESVRIAEEAAAAEEAEANRLAEEAKIAEEEAARLADEAAAEAELQRLAEESKAEAEAQRLAEEEKAKADAATDQKTEAEPAKFRLDGKGIFVGEERVAGLYGEEKQLRVFKDELRPEIEAWLLTLTPTEQ